MSQYISIIINNYNYDCFLEDCINSAIAQTYKNKEIIVVDDGSTDTSRSVIKKYTGQIRPLLKENGGQGSAFNVGFSAARGNLVLFLDSDDMLLPDILEYVAEAFETNKNVAKVQFQLEVIDKCGRSLHRREPPDQSRMPSGDMRGRLHVLQNIICPPTSGNAYSVRKIKNIFPIPETFFRACADGYLNPLALVFGEVISLPRVGGQYRMHGRNFTSTKSFELTRIRTTLERSRVTRTRQKELMRKLYDRNIPVNPRGDVTFIRSCAVSHKLDPKGHPFADNLFFLCMRGCLASFLSPRWIGRKKFVSFFWFPLFLVSPRRISKSLIEPIYKR